MSLATSRHGVRQLDVEPVESGEQGWWVHADREPVKPGSRRRPTVVIFDSEGPPVVEVLELPEATGVGARLEHFGTVWEVTGFRSRSRVLLAQPVRH